MPRPDLVAGSSRIFTVEGGPRGPLLVIGGRAAADDVRRARRELQAGNGEGESDVVELYGHELDRLASLSEGPGVEKALDLVFDIKRIFCAFAPTVTEVRGRGVDGKPAEREPG